MDRRTWDALPGLARVAVSSGWRVMTWTVEQWRDLGRQLLALDPTKAAEAQKPHAPPGVTTAELRARGDALLYDSADVWYEGDTHPAYARILEELSPDEARILRFLCLEGPQPSVDVRTRRPLGVGSELVEGGLSMIGLHAGTRNPGHTKAELNNLFRLGLIWFSREQVQDPSRYQVVEVQPEVQEAVRRAHGRSRTLHRSIHLTPFGEDFCRTCFSFANGSSNGSAPSATP